MQLSDHFSLGELTRSQVALRRGIDNTPSDEVIEALKLTAAWMEKVRELLKVPIHVLSGYRSLKLNAAVNGSSTSQHCLGEAVDFVAPEFGQPLAICQRIRDSDIEFDQLIYEGTWVHVSFREMPRGNVMTAHFNNGKTTYSKGLFA